MLQALKRKCENFILYGEINETQVMDAIENDPSLSKLGFSKIRQKIQYLRKQLLDEGGNFLS